MNEDTNKHEEIIKMVHLLDKWRLRPPTEQETNALNIVAKEKYPHVLKTISQVNLELKYKPRILFLMKYNSGFQTLALAITAFWAIVYFANVGNIITSGPLISLIQNPLFVITMFVLLVTFATLMYLYRKDSNTYKFENLAKLKEIKMIVDDLIYSLNPLAINKVFKANQYPFKLNFDDYKGLRLLGRSGRSTYQLSFSLSHSLMSKAKTVKILSSFGRLSFFQALRGFKGGQPAIKVVNSEIPAGAKDFLRGAADWRQQGVDVIVRKAKIGVIKDSYLILDDKEVWIVPYLLEELDSKESLDDFTPIKDKTKVTEALEKFDKIWKTSTKSEELEEISWRTYYKEKFAREKKG